MGMRGAHEIKRFVSEKGFGKFDALALFLLGVFCIQGCTFFLLIQSVRIILFTCLACAVVVSLWIWHRVLPYTIDTVCRKIFPVVLIVLGASFALFFPPGSVPDGIYHFKTTYAYSNILSFQQVDSLRASDVDVVYEGTVVSMPISSEHWQIANNSLELFASDGTIVDHQWLLDSGVIDEESIGLPSTLPLPQLKVPAALGILLARAIGLGALPMFYLGRLFNMLYAAILIILAVRLTPIGKNIFMTAALMPMTLHLLGSYSYDAPLIGMAFLLTALLLRAMRGRGRISAQLCIAIVLVAVIMAPCKVVYMTICFIVIFVPSNRFSSRARGNLFKVCVILLPLAVAMVLSLTTLLPNASAGNGQVQDTGIGAIETYSLGELLNNPLSTYMLFANTFLIHASNYLAEMVGGVPGWLEGRVQLATWASFSLVFLLFGSSVRTADDNDYLPVSQRISFFVLFTLSVLATMAVMAIYWTANTDMSIQGVQGRYFLPVIILLLLALRSKCIQVHARTSLPLVMTLSGVGFMYLATITLNALA